MNKTGYVYIMTNKNKTVLYIGVTNNLVRRIYEHKNHIFKNSFADKYNCEYCIYYEEWAYFDLAINREKELKKWNRQKKDDLINKKNPEWRELVNERGYIRHRLQNEDEIVPFSWNDNGSTIEDEIAPFGWNDNGSTIEDEIPRFGWNDDGSAIEDEIPRFARNDDDTPQGREGSSGGEAAATSFPSLQDRNRHSEGAIATEESSVQTHNNINS
ncbi:MAG: hypothetical protein EZS26_001857 [Candidatus Ordinivivax streblomastigis]|uniref:GIY-YIG domain-containing protein n=1 Tax=Candidatus Ordinivivax streblomastigis TaxID=2540710 RepID=A0A5M8P0W3_9BACT|nr:MAG: hypothetical protein EZS26_001857 [Candidatus Ordinivivax streblomastigis]